MKNWFVVLRSSSGKFPIPLVDENEDICLFESEELARKAGSQNIIGESFGFEVYKF